MCLGVKKESKSGEARTGRCHLSVGGSTGLKSPWGGGFTADCPAVVST